MGGSTDLSAAARRKEGKVQIVESMSILERRGKSKIKATADPKAKGVTVTVVSEKNERSKGSKIWPVIGSVFSPKAGEIIDPE